MKNSTTPQQVVSVCEEVQHLMENWALGDIEERDIRAGSNTLRRLLVHKELNRVWNTLVGAKKFIVPAAHIVIDHHDLIKLYDLYTCSEVRHKSMTIYSVMAYRGKSKMVPTGNGKFRDETVRGAHIEQAEMTLNQFIESVCLIAEGTIIKRNWVVQYVANALGGAHFGEKSRKGPSFDSAMSKLRKFDVGNMPASIQELLAIGQALCRAESTRILMEAYAEWKMKNPGIRIA